jgi:hypothetical protein
MNFPYADTERAIDRETMSSGDKKAPRPSIHREIGPKVDARHRDPDAKLAGRNLSFDNRLKAAEARIDRVLARQAEKRA